MRTMPIPPIPGGVDMEQMVSLCALFDVSFMSCPKLEKARDTLAFSLASYPLDEPIF